MKTTRNEKIEALTAFYRETGENYRHFLDWRHKLIVRYFAFTAGFFLMFKWLNEEKIFINNVWILFLAGFIITICIWGMDNRSKNLFRSCQQAGEEIEKELMPNKKIGIYGKINATTKNNKIIATNIINAAYCLMSFIFACLTIYYLIKK